MEHNQFEYRYITLNLQLLEDSNMFTVKSTHIDKKFVMVAKAIHKMLSKDLCTGGKKKINIEKYKYFIKF